MYSPRYNGIEEVFSQAKHQVKKRRLHCLLNGLEEDLGAIIVESFESLSPQHIAKCVARSLDLLALQ